MGIAEGAGFRGAGGGSEIIGAEEDTDFLDIEEDSGTPGIEEDLYSLGEESVASLDVGTTEGVDYLDYFWLTYLCCVLQIVLFLLILYVQRRYENLRGDRNYAQISLVTAILLLGGAVAAMILVVQREARLPISIGRVIIVYWAAILTWAGCAYFWFRHLCGLIPDMDDDYFDFIERLNKSMIDA